jgi:ABC-type transport system involved in cytochrome bd biosynthesis fused ATPase/permease subunit
LWSFKFSESYALHHRKSELNVTERAEFPKSGFSPLLDRSWTFPRQLAASSLHENLAMEQQKVYIAVMGVTGAGKSSFIKTATGMDVEIGHTFMSCETYAAKNTCETLRN